MDVLVTIVVIDETGEELASVSSSTATPQAAFDLAMQEIDVEF